MKIQTERVADWIKQKIEDANAKGAVVGLSGGVDSSVVASLCVKAVGVENVVGVLMPCESNSDDFSHATDLALKLEIETFNMYLNKTYNMMLAFLPFFINDLAKGNIKARLRMTTLYAIANQLNYLVVGTGNKTELLLGYYTKYGDGGVDLEPLNDFYKTEVFEMARELGVPEHIINKAPSAGLWEGQTDEEEIGCSYEMIDKF